jgi:uncharacterized repeat protein (TIGR01451 family)
MFNDAVETYGNYGTLMACQNVANQLFDTVAEIIAIDSFDPNAIGGPSGVGSAEYINGQQPLTYSVSFENLPTATAPAQQVVVTDQLDSNTVNLASFALGPLSFGSNQVIPPSGSTNFATTVDLRPTQDLLVDITASLDPNSGLVTWRFSSIDPATGNPPTDPMIGFCPQIPTRRKAKGRCCSP